MIYIVIPVHNRKEYTRGCLLCLSQQTYKNFVTIVVDDGSIDGTSEMVNESFPEVVIIKGNGNLWWTKAINTGIQYVQEYSTQVEIDVILTLNDDLTFNPDYLATLMSIYEANRPCLVGSVVVDIKNSNYLEYAGISCNYYSAKGIKTSTLFNNNYKLLKEKHEVVQTDELSGRGTLIPLEVFQKIGKFDDINFPHYMADIEMSVRARRAGYKLLISVDSVIHNYMEATRNKRQTWPVFLGSFFSFKSPNYIRTRYTFAKRHSPIASIYLVSALGRILLSYILKRNP